VGGNPVQFIDPEGLLVKRCYRYLGSPDKGDTSIINPLRHDYLVINDTTYSYSSKGGFVWSEGQVTVDNEDPYRASCSVIWEGSLHDKYVEDAIREAGIPQYGIGPQASDCQEWSDGVLENASNKFDSENPKNLLESIASSFRDIYWYGQ
jgi:hypothetical protein